MNNIENLEPQSLWNNFIALNAVPRPSKKEEKVRAFMIDFGKKLNLDVSTDEIGNVLIKKPATIGMENRKTVVMQSHLDMVCQKNNDVDFDFETQGIQMYIDGDFVKAKGTTLGADNGIGVATIMAILASKDIPHPAIEAIFTIDEETGMTGALKLDPTILSGDILLNLDTEEDDELDIGCAGGIDVTATKSYISEKISTNDYSSYKITVKGLQGGHSGMDIHKGFGNANKLLARFLFSALNFNTRLASIESGGLRNAIPREGFAIVNIAKKDETEFLAQMNQLKEEIINEYNFIEKNITILIENCSLENNVLPINEQQQLTQALMAAHNGVYRMSPDIDDLVETSNNVANVIAKDGNISVLCLTRSSVESNKMALAYTLQSTFELAGFEVKFSGEYPGWKPNPNSEILEVMQKIYVDTFKSQPKVVACHAGLECGIIGSHYPNLDMISFGPNIFGAHSPDERVEIKSVQKYWQFLLATLQEIPRK